MNLPELIESYLELTERDFPDLRSKLVHYSKRIQIHQSVANALRGVADQTKSKREKQKHLRDADRRDRLAKAYVNHITAQEQKMSDVKTLTQEGRRFAVSASGMNRVPKGTETAKVDVKPQAEPSKEDLFAAMKANLEKLKKAAPEGKTTHGGKVFRRHA